MTIGWEWLTSTRRDVWFQKSYCWQHQIEKTSSCMRMNVLLKLVSTSLDIDNVSSDVLLNLVSLSLRTTSTNYVIKMDMKDPERRQRVQISLRQWNFFHQIRNTKWTSYVEQGFHSQHDVSDHIGIFCILRFSYVSFKVWSLRPFSEWIWALLYLTSFRHGWTADSGTDVSLSLKFLLWRWREVMSLSLPCNGITYLTERFELIYIRTKKKSSLLIDVISSYFWSPSRPSYKWEFRRDRHIYLSSVLTAEWLVSSLSSCIPIQIVRVIVILWQDIVRDIPHQHSQTAGWQHDEVNFMRYPFERSSKHFTSFMISMHWSETLQIHVIVFHYISSWPASEKKKSSSIPDISSEQHKHQK